jgi:hypothetical protein
MVSNLSKQQADWFARYQIAKAILEAKKGR